MKRILSHTLLFALFLLVLPLSAQKQPPSDKARGIFLAVGLGPRLPLGDFGKVSFLGYGYNMELSYTDNEYLPVFLFGKIGFEQYPASQDYYQASEYSHFSTNMLPLTVGARYFFAPFMERVVIIMPVLEVSSTLLIFQNFHQFKTNRPGYIEEGTKLGFSAGIGASMFLLDIMTNYHYFPDNQFISFDLKIRIPLVATI
ncbi:MAG: hypothetical protein IT279_04610 [Ignavibacteriaceae bacterium]|nr:hypothetical protein [Ignavibacteriaceae bacterium]